MEMFEATGRASYLENAIAAQREWDRVVGLGSIRVEVGLARPTLPWEQIAGLIDKPVDVIEQQLEERIKELGVCNGAG
jgi:hypothetical protein